jgi:AcrR family transcriptional regulator
MDKESKKPGKSSRRQRLIDIGMDLFSEYSYEDVAINDIAAAADISKGLLYYYFPTKHDFYVAVVQYAADQLLRETRVDSGAGPVERLRVGVHAYFSYVERYATAYVALLRGGVGVDAQVTAILNAVRHAYVQRVLRTMPAGWGDSPARLIALKGWIGFIEATSIAWLEQRSLSQEELCDLAMAVFTATLTRGENLTAQQYLF